MLHTIVDQNLFLQQANEEQPVQYEDIPLACGVLEIDSKSRAVCRVFSTDPKDYLDKRYFPGEIFRPEKPGK